MCEVRTTEVTRRLARNFEGLFPGRNLVTTPPHVVVTLVLKTVHRQTAMSTPMLEERQECHKRLVARMQAFQQHLDDLDTTGHWCDFIDPATGAPFVTDSSTTLLECDERYRSLGFEILELGCCRAVCCEKFGQCMVMTSAFVQAPREALDAAIARLEQDSSPLESYSVLDEPAEAKTCPPSEPVDLGCDGGQGG